MRFILIALATVSFTASANQKQIIKGWKHLQDLSQDQAITLASEAFQKDLELVEEGETCGAEEMWNWEREREVINDFPQGRGEYFALLAYVRGPHSERGCSGIETYDCRAVFNRAEANSPWAVKYVECEPTTILNQD